jgi:hypothetical protein
MIVYAVCTLLKVRTAPNQHCAVALSCNANTSTQCSEHWMVSHRQFIFCELIWHSDLICVL